MVDWTIPTVTNLQSKQAMLLTLPPEQAQPYCNFVLFAPSQLPKGFMVTEQSLRRECIPGRLSDMPGRSPWSEANNCAYRMVISDGVRRIRVKQFLYDWAPAAADQPCLWQSKTTYKPLQNGFVAWFGKDYKNQVGAYTAMFRTSCEVSVEHGEFTVDELHGLLDSLQPVSQQALKIINQQPFFKLSYWARFSCSNVNVPYGLWYYRRLNNKEKRIWNVDLNKITHIAAKLNLASMVRFGYNIDSICHFNEMPSAEVQFIFSTLNKSYPQLNLFIDSSNTTIQIPPKLEKHPCVTETFMLGILTIYLAYVSVECGPFEVTWQDDKNHYRGLLLCSSHTQMTKETFIEIVRGLIKHA
jgi:hypothetical protein